MKFKKVLLSSALATLLASAAVLPTTAAETVQYNPNLATVQCTSPDGSCTVPNVTTEDPTVAFGGYDGAEKEVVDPVTGLPSANPYSDESYDTLIAGEEAVTAPSEEPEATAPETEETPTTEDTEQAPPATDEQNKPGTGDDQTNANPSAPGSDSEVKEPGDEKAPGDSTPANGQDAANSGTQDGPEKVEDGAKKEETQEGSSNPGENQGNGPGATEASTTTSPAAGTVQP